MRRVLILVAMLGLARGVAQAEDLATYEVDGEAASAGSDPRVAALDDAFGRAATSALVELVPGAVRAAKKQVLDREIVGRARLWISKFSVVKDETNDDRRQLTVSVRVDRDKMRARLDELGISTSEGSSPTPGEPVAGKARPVVIMLRVTDPETSHVTFGANADKDVAGTAAIAGALKAGGYVVKRPPTSGEARATGDLPLDDAEAGSLAAEAKADVALIAGVTVGRPIPVRGQASLGILVVAHVRLFDARAQAAIGEGAATVAATKADQVPLAIERAVRAALGDVLPPTTHALATITPAGFHGDDTPVAADGVVLVRVGVKTPLALVLAEQKYLLGAKGVSRASIRRLSPGGWIIGVTTTESAEKIASIARRPPTKDARVSVRVVNAVVEVTLTGAPPP